MKLIIHSQTSMRLQMGEQKNGISSPIRLAETAIIDAENYGNSFCHRGNITATNNTPKNVSIFVRHSAYSRWLENNICCDKIFLLACTFWIKISLLFLPMQARYIWKKLAICNGEKLCQRLDQCKRHRAYSYTTDTNVSESVGRWIIARSHNVRNARV